MKKEVQYSFYIPNKAYYIKQQPEEEKIMPEQIYIYPNPAQNNLFVEFSNNFDLNNTYIEISDVFGKTILKQNIHNQTNSINISNLPQGIFLINIFNNNISIKKDKLLKLY
jgi:hypothetical protein